MYLYDEIDQQIVDERVQQFRDQTERYLAGRLSEDDFRPLRLQNGLYIQRHAPMLRVAIPYGVLSATKMRMLARIAREFDRGYAHFTTRQNVQFNWPTLESVPDILALLAKVQMHAIQTSGNCIRNTTTDHFAGVAHDEEIDPRPYTELIRQWSTFHPEFAFLPRKFKIAVNGARHDRAATRMHDIGVDLVRDSVGQIGYRILVGGGLGRTPLIGHVIRAFLPEMDLLTYLDAILRVYNRYGRRDNKYKARIKILVKELSPAKFIDAVETEWQRIREGAGSLVPEELARIRSRMLEPTFLPPAPDAEDKIRQWAGQDPIFKRWLDRNTHGHKKPGYISVLLSLKGIGETPGDLSDVQMDGVADLADRFSFGEIRVTHMQNLVLPSVRIEALHDLYTSAKVLGLATANLGLISDLIACPGGDFCSLANARSIPVAKAIALRFSELDYQEDIGPIEVNVSGCMNACGHHHVGHIGILGVDKHGEEFYQITVGGSQAAPAALGRVIGPSLKQEDIPDVLERLIQTYLGLRESVDDRFIDVVQRTGIEPFKEAVYGPPAH